MLVVATVAGAWAGPVAGLLERPEGTRAAARASYVVAPGDTLWSIARSVAPGDDPRPLIDSIVSANALDPGSLVPGRVLVIPAAG